MTDPNAVVYALIGLITLGMTVHAWSLYSGSPEAKPSRFLMAAFLLSDLTCLLVLGVIFSPVFLTLFNTSLLFTIWAVALAARSWRMALSKRDICGTGIVMLGVSAAFEYMRQHHPYADRVVFYTVISTLLLLWVMHEVWQRHKQDKAFQLQFMMGVIVCGIGLRVTRLVFVLQQTVQPENLLHEQALPAMLRHATLSIDVLVLSSLLAYSTHLLATRHQKTAADHRAEREAHQKLQWALQEKDQLLKALTTATKSRHMGVVLASVAHELNQPLSTLRLKTEFLLSQSHFPQPERQALLTEMLQDNIRAADIVAQLRGFLRQGSSTLQDLEIDRLVQDALRILAPELQSAEMQLNLDIQPYTRIHGNEGQLQMVLLNLIKNALDALQALPAPHQLRIKLWSHSGGVNLQVCDNGPGVPEAQQERVFDMFFSTKTEGMGMGLWLSRAIMQHHGGEMTVTRSDLGGASFHLSWPLPAQTP